MKKLIYALVVFAFISNLSAQSGFENLVQISDVPRPTNPQVYATCQSKTITCYAYNSSDIDRSIVRLESLVNKTEFNFNEDRIIHQSLSQPDISVVTITHEDIKRVPATMGEVDIISTLKLMGCPGSINIDDVTACSEIQVIELEDMPLESVITVTSEKSTQGPITGLEGHNFIEEPAIIYPNPVKEIMNIKSTDPITVIEILNAHGQIEKIMNVNEQLIVSDLPAGIYYARISFENRKEVQVEKILIVK